MPMEVLEVEILDATLSLRTPECKGRHYWHVDAKIRVKYRVPPYTKAFYYVCYEVNQFFGTVHNASNYELDQIPFDNLYSGEERIEERTIDVHFGGDFTTVPWLSNWSPRDFDVHVKIGARDGWKVVWDEVTFKCHYESCSFTIKEVIGLKASLTISTTPTGARVFIDENYIGVT